MNPTPKHVNHDIDYQTHFPSLANPSYSTDPNSQVIYVILPEHALTNY